MRLTVAATFACIALASHANAQNNVVVINNGNRLAAASDKPRTVTINFQLSMPAPAVSSSSDMTSAMAATKSVAIRHHQP